MPRSVRAAALRACLVGALVALGASASARAAEPLVAQWHFDTVTSTTSADTTPDSSGNGFDLSSCHACIRISSGGRFGDYLATSSPLQTTSGIRPQRVTLLTWFRKSNNDYQDEVVAGQGWNASTCGMLSYALLSGTDGGDDVRFQVRQPNGDTIADVTSPDSTAASDGSWHLVAGVFDGTKVLLYVDGNLVGSTPADSDSIDYGTGGVFGADGFAGGTTCSGSVPFTGDLDELRVYDRALTATEIARLASASGSTPPDLVPDSPPPQPQQPPPPTTNQPPAPSTPPGQPFFPPPTPPVASFSVPAGPVKLFRPARRHHDGRHQAPVGLQRRRPYRPRRGPDPAGAGGQVRAAGPLPGEAHGRGGRRGALELVTPARGHRSEPRRGPASAASGDLPQSECDKAKQEFSAGTEDAYVTSGGVDLNGLRIRPVGPAHVVLYPAAERVISSFATVTWGNFPVWAGPVDWNLDNLDLQRREGNIVHTGDSGFARLLDFDASNLGDVAGFHPTGTVALTLRRSNGAFWSEGSVNLSLPNEFDFLGGKAPTANVLVTASNDAEPVLDHLKFTVPEVDLGALDMTDLSFRYELNGGIDNDVNPLTSCNHKEWKATGNIFLIGTADEPDGSASGIKMTPPPSQNGVEFCRGNFKAAGADLVFGDAAPEVFPGVELSDINFAMQVDPTLLRAGLGLDVAKLAHIDGTGLVVLASTTKPYYLSPGDAGGQLALLAGRTFSAPTFAVGGDVYVTVPVYGRLKFGDGALMYSYPNDLYAGGEVRMTLPGFSLTGGLSGQADLATRKFEASAGANLCFGGFDDACIGVTAWVGTRGIAGCINVGKFHPGAGYRWADHYLGVWPFDGCKPSRFWEREFHPGTKRAARTAAGGVTVTLARGERSKDIELDGSGGAPSVTVRSPDGRTLDVVGHRLIHGSGLAGVRIEAENATFIGIEGAPGRYVIEPLPGSAPIARVLMTRPGYDSNFTARVSGRGAHRTLIYDARRPEGQVVTLAERSRNVFHILGSSRGGRGRLRFTPAIGPGGRRQIVAMATLDGTAIPEQTLTSYIAPGIPRTGRPGRVRVRRSGTRLSVSWTAAAGAKRYAIVLRLSDGSMRAVRVGPRRRSVRIGRVDTGGTVQVSAQGVLGDWARPASAPFRRLRAPFTVQQTNRHNERLTYLAQHRARRRRRR